MIQNIKYNVADVVAAQNIAAADKRSLPIFDNEEPDPETQARLLAYNQDLQPVRLSQVHLPQLPIVQLTPDANPSCPSCIADDKFLVLGEIAQWPGSVAVIGMTTGKLYTEFNTDQLAIFVVE